MPAAAFVVIRLTCAKFANATVHGAAATIVTLTKERDEAQAAELAEYHKLKADIDAGVIVLEMPREDDDPGNEFEKEYYLRGLHR